MDKRILDLEVADIRRVTHPAELSEPHHWVSPRILSKLHFEALFIIFGRLPTPVSRPAPALERNPNSERLDGKVHDLLDPQEGLDIVSCAMYTPVRKDHLRVLECDLYWLGFA